MDDFDGSPPSSLWMIRAAELFPKLPMEKDDEQLSVPFQELAGEFVRYLGRADDGILALSNYRLFLLKASNLCETSIPLGLIESAQIRELFHIIINCKDASTITCSFPIAEQCVEWHRRIALAIGVPENLESLFAFPFYSWTSDLLCNENTNWCGRLQRAGRFEDDFYKEIERLQFDLSGTWRISQANVDFNLCPSYPPLILVPSCISDKTLNLVANFRGSRRLPAVVWRHKQSGAVIARCSQPEVGWLGWRNAEDEELLKALADACAFDCQKQNGKQTFSISGESTPSSVEGSHEDVCLEGIKKILIVDARSYTSAVTNRARGGGCECIEYYPCAEIEFMNLGNIHVIRKSFNALRQLYASPPDVQNWLGLLERTMWLQHLSGLLSASMTVCHAIEKNGRPVLVHCSDGWDRTSQIIATAQLCLDPFYRTIEGFRILVEREWLSFGHKFADRCGHGPGSEEPNERCPIFLQWLDVVHQIHRQFPCSFEFNMAYLIKLAQHSHSCLFGTFLCNTIKERQINSVYERTFSVWPFFSGTIYKNPLYFANKDKVLWPAYNVRDLVLWREIYMGSLGNQNILDGHSNSTDIIQEQTGPIVKTRSYGDLFTPGILQNSLARRSSDPNMTIEANFLSSLSNENEINKSKESSLDLVANIINETTVKLENLTNNLNELEDDTEVFRINGEYNINNKQSQFDAQEIDKINSTNNSKLEYPTSEDSLYLDFNKKDKIDKSNTLDNDNDLNGSVLNVCASNGISDLLQSINLQEDNCWHGSVETSTDTLVPIEKAQTNIVVGKINSTDSSVSEESSKMINRIFNKKRLIYEDLAGIHLKTDEIDGHTNRTMDESILIQPEHSKLEISSNGKCETVVNNIKNTSSHRRRKTSLSPKIKDSIGKNILNTSVPNGYFSTTQIDRLKQFKSSGSGESFNTHITCYDGLAHALSEENIRLHQIVHKHMLREDALQRELHGMRMALLKKTCPNCNNQLLLQDDQVNLLMETNEAKDIADFCKFCSHPNRRNCNGHDDFCFGFSSKSGHTTLESSENISVSSWEAVEDRSGTSLDGGSNQSAGNILWVPDHAVTRCTSCQIEFWLGRRKHHCRSCGQIFCSDCSEFWAPIPEERLYNPVRQCETCYRSTIKINETSSISSLNGSKNNNTQMANPNFVSITKHQYTDLNNKKLATLSIEPCKRTANQSQNERQLFNATTTASN